MTRRFREFMDVAAEVFRMAASKEDYTVTYSGFLESLKPIQGGEWHVTVPNAELVLSKAAVRQFVKDRLGGMPGMVNDERLQPSTVLQYMRDLATGHEDRTLAVRRTGINVDAILSEQYALYDNLTLINNLVTMAHDGTLPPANELFVHSFYADDAARNVHLRLISPSNWNFKGGDGQEYYGSIVFNNNELGDGSLQFCAALARVACFNFTIGTSQFNIEHRYSTMEEMNAALKAAVRRMGDYSKAMFERMEQSQGVSFDDPLAVFNLIMQRMKLPEKVSEDTMAYWENEGEDASLYGITQALTWGVQAATPTKGRRKPKWEVRSNIESNVTQWMEEILRIHQEGDDINEWVSQAALIGKHKVLEVLENNQWEAAAIAVRSLEADGWL